MPAKQKITLYISDDLHRQFKIRSAIDGETMSSMAQRAIAFYLTHPEAVEETGETHGQTHRVHACPKCDAAVALRDGELAVISSRAEQPFEELTKLERVPELSCDSLSLDEGELIGCS